MTSERPLVGFDVTPLQNAHRLRGIGRYVEGLARALLAQREIAIEFWGWRDARPFEVAPPHRGLWLRRFALPRTRWSWTLGPLGMRLRARMSSVRLVHVTDPRAFKPLRLPTLTTVYDLIPLLDPATDRSTGEYRHYRRWLRRLPGARGIFAISGQTAEDLRTHLRIPPPPVWIAPPGVSALSASRAEASRGGGAGEQGRYFLYLGSADPHKNLTTLLQAYERVTSLPERLLFAGPWYGDDLPALQRWLEVRPRLRGRVEYLGFIDDGRLPPLIRDATAVVVPSRREGFGLPVAEAMAAGGVVIHSRIPILEEVSQGAALSFDPESAEELAAAMERLSGDASLRRRLRLQGEQRARSLTWEAALATTLRAYGEVLSTSGE